MSDESTSRYRPDRCISPPRNYPISQPRKPAGQSPDIDVEVGFALILRFRMRVRFHGSIIISRNVRDGIDALVVLREACDRVVAFETTPFREAILSTRRMLSWLRMRRHVVGPETGGIHRRRD